MIEQRVSGYVFRPDHLAPERRRPGISAFMRVRNGEDFLDQTIRSHIGALDEVVAVLNRCTDRSLEILEKLQAEFGGKIRIFDYEDRVHPPGSDGHAKEAADSPASFVNMSNFALSRTRFSVAVKLDDDHLAMEERFVALSAGIRDKGCRLEDTLCFSGINLAWRDPSHFGVPAVEPLVGAGDHFFFEVTPETIFIHDRRFEDFRHRGRRIFGDTTYWHLKHLKAGGGFANRALDEAGNERFRRKQERFERDRRLLSMDELKRMAPRALDLLAKPPLPEKQRLKLERWRSIRDRGPTQAQMEEIFRRLGFATEAPSP